MLCVAFLYITLTHTLIQFPFFISMQRAQVGDWHRVKYNTFIRSPLLQLKGVLTYDFNSVIKKTLAPHE